MTRLSPAFLCVVALLIAVLTACKARAEITFGCQFVWNNASDQNSVSHCLASPNIGTQWKLLIMPVLAGFFLVCILVYFFFFICCKGSMGTIKDSRPKTKEGRERLGCWLYMLIVWFIIFTLAVSFLIIFGADRLHSSLQNVVQAMEKNSMNDVIYTRDLIINYTKGKKDLPIETKQFDNLINDLQDHINALKASVPGLFTAAQVIADFAGIMGVLMMMLVLSVACCKCTGIGLGVFTIVYVVFSVLYALLAVGFTIFMYFVIAGCGEITQQYHRAPGIGQWYYVPWCNSKYKFTEGLEQLKNASQDIRKKACDTIIKYCDDAVPALDGSVVFECTTKTSDECFQRSDTENIFGDIVYLKPMLNNLLVTNTTGWSFMPNVTVSECAERCSDIANFKAKTFSNELLQSAQNTDSISTVISYMRPMVDCNYVVDNFLISTQTKDSSGGSWNSQGMTSGCANMTTASILLGVGFLVGAVMFLIGFYVLQRGSFIWIRKTEYDAPSSSSDSDFE